MNTAKAQKAHKARFQVTLSKENVDDALEIQKELVGARNLSSLLDNILAEWVKEKKEQIGFNQIIEDVLFPEKKKKDMTALDVINEYNPEKLRKIIAEKIKQQKEGGKS